jgi:hypothetical protein
MQLEVRVALLSVRLHVSKHTQVSSCMQAMQATCQAG